MTLKELREQRTDMTQSELAQKAGIPLRSYQDYEQDRKPIQNASGTTIHGLARALHVSMETIVELESERTMYAVIDEWGGDMFTAWYTSKDRNQAIQDAKNQWANIQRDEDHPEQHHVYVGKKHDRFVNPYGTWELSDSVDDFDMNVVWDCKG